MPKIMIELILFSTTVDLTMSNQLCKIYGFVTLLSCMNVYGAPKGTPGAHKKLSGAHDIISGAHEKLRACT